MVRERANSIGSPTRHNEYASASAGNNIESTSLTTSPRMSPHSPRASSPRFMAGLFTKKRRSAELYDINTSSGSNSGSSTAINSVSNNINAETGTSPPSDSKETKHSTHKTGTSADDLRKSLLTRACQDTQATVYNPSQRRASYVNHASPIVPLLQLYQKSASLNKVDTTTPLPNTWSQISSDFISYSSGEDTTESDDDKKGRTGSSTDIVNTSIDMVLQTISSGECEDGDHEPLVDKKPVNIHLTRVNRTRNRTGSYVKEDELQSTDGDDHGIRSVLAVHEVLNSEPKTIQSLLDEKMVLLRALFDVPEWGEFNSVALWVSTIFLANNKAMTVVQWSLKQEVQAIAEDDLFRGDSMPSALVANFLRLIGNTYMQRVLSPIILKMHQTKKSYEIDLSRGGSKSNAPRLRKLAKRMLKSIFDSISFCPRILREYLFQMCDAIRERYSEEIALKTVSSFFFLRVVCTCIFDPNSCGILESMQQLTPTAKRGLVLVTKILQNIANGVCTEYTESHMSKINKLLVASSKPMRQFMEQMCRRPVQESHIQHDCYPTPQQYKSAVCELQKYITKKLDLIPKVRDEGATTSEHTTRLLKLRRALQSYSLTWRNPTVKMTTRMSSMNEVSSSSIMNTSPVGSEGLFFSSATSLSTEDGESLASSAAIVSRK